MAWKSIEFEPRLPTLGRNSACFLQRIRKRYLLLVYEANLTTALLLRTESNELFVECAKKIPSELTLVKITGNNNCIVMYDGEQDLFYLEGTIAHTTEPLDIYTGNMFLNKFGSLTWKRRHHMFKCLAMTGITNAISFLFHCGSIFTALYNSICIKDGLKRISHNAISDFDSNWKYSIISVEGEMAKIIGWRIFNTVIGLEQILFVPQQSHMIFIMATAEGQILSKSYPIDFQSDSIINVMTFDKRKCILIICQSGKIVSLNFNNCKETFQIIHAWLPKHVTAILGYEDDFIYLYWSDMAALYLSSLDDDNTINYIQIFSKMKCVVHLLKIDDHILAITLDGCIYETQINSIPDKDVTFSSHEVLKKILKLGKITRELNEEIVRKEYMLEVLTISKKKNVHVNINVTLQEGIIALENKTEHLFRKSLWRLCLQRKESGSRHSERKELDQDLVPGGIISIKCDKSIPNRLILISDLFKIPVSIILELNYDGSILKNDDYLITVKDFLKDKSEFIA